MRRVILRLILVFGRFATIPVPTAGLALLFGWFTLLDNDRLAALILAPLLAYLHKEHLALRRQNELAADGHAAAHVGAEDMGRALAIFAAARDILREVVFQPLEQEMLGAIRPPTPPMQRIKEQLAALRDPDRINAVVARLMQAPEQAGQSRLCRGAQIRSSALLCRRQLARTRGPRLKDGEPGRSMDPRCEYISRYPLSR